MLGHFVVLKIGYVYCFSLTNLERSIYHLKTGRLLFQTVVHFRFCAKIFLFVSKVIPQLTNLVQYQDYFLTIILLEYLLLWHHLNYF